MLDATLNRYSRTPNRNAAQHAPRIQSSIAPSWVGTNEDPGIALLRHFLFPVCTVVALLLTAAVFRQPFTRSYVILAVLSFALSWRLLSSAEFRELRPLSETQYFVPRLLFSWANVFAILLFVGFASKSSAAYSRMVVVTWALFTPCFYAAARFTAHRALCHWNRTRRIARTHVIVGTNAGAQQFAERLERDGSLGTFIGFFDERSKVSQDRRVAVSVLGGIEDLAAYVRRNSIDVIHIALPLSEHRLLDGALNELRDTTTSIYFLPDVPKGAHNQLRIVEMAGTPLLIYFETPHCGLPGAAKRALDLGISTLMIAMLSPVMLAIAVLIRLDSRGPIIFKQRRYGLNGEEIPVYKFRTMKTCDDGDTVSQAQRNDPRVTRLGSFLRRSSLDELPQLFCVLTGSMSLVGPRPHAVAHNEMYRRLIDGYMLRHKVRPGITGWAQVNGLRGETSTIDRMQMRVVYDLDYLQHWSPWIDIKILWRTALLVFGDRNAY